MVVLQVSSQVVGEAIFSRFMWGGPALGLILGSRLEHRVQACGFNLRIRGEGTYF